MQKRNRSEALNLDFFLGGVEIICCDDVNSNWLWEYYRKGTAGGEEIGSLGSKDEQPESLSARVDKNLASVAPE